MPVKVFKKLFLHELPKDIKKNFARNIKDKIGDIIKGKILRGETPVSGHGTKFVPYSEAYAKVKGKKAPVDMLVTGKMLNSLKVKQDKLGRVEIYFDDDKARYHSIEGEGRVHRPLLPERGETFKQDVMREINKELNKATKKATDKQNR
jgi:hypothetical protein